MPYSMITYRIKPGHEKELTELFAKAPQLESPIITNERGEETGRLIGTGVFVKDDVCVRLVHYEGDFKGIARHLASQTHVHVIEQQIGQYLAEPRDTSTPEGFATWFKDATMQCIVQLSGDEQPSKI